MSNSLETPSASTIVGHVRNGVVVIDTHVSFDEGQVVRIEPFSQKMLTEQQQALSNVERLRQLFALWNEEDGLLPADEADQLHNSMRESERVQFRIPAVD